MSFVHLHNHTEYSLLDGAARVKVLVARAKELNMPAVAITDHGVMFGAIHFYKAAKEAGIKPIIGCEVYISGKSRFDRDGREESAYHLVLLAENEEGYHNLCHLVSLAYLEGFYYKPRIDKELLRQYHQGIIALSACIGGEIPAALLKNNPEKAYALAQEYLEIFGEGNFFIELQDHSMPEEKFVNPQLAGIAAELHIPLVATNDIHYVYQEDATMHDILLCIQTGKTRDEENRMRFPTEEFYLKTEEQMGDLFAAYPEALENTIKIADRCQVDFEFGKFYLPFYDVPEGYTLDTYLTALCQEGVKKRYGVVTPEIQKRLDYELNVIITMDFSGYFLIVWDVINFCRQNDIPVGPGRGSAAGSLVAYSLTITNLDPLKYNLLFERFLNPERVNPPDIDTDFCFEKRGRVIEYLVQKYGQERVGQIATFGTMKARGAVRDVGRALDIPYSDVDRLAKLVPADLGMTLDKALQDVPELKAAYDGDMQIRELLDLCMKIEGMPRHASTHAAGVVIAQKKIIDYMPVWKTADGFVTTQFEKDDVEGLGLVKMDILGLRTLTVIKDALDNIKKSCGTVIDIDNISVEDQDTYDLLCSGDTGAVFQLESEGMRKILCSLHPECFEDIVALVALYRPGPLGSGMVDDFIKNKHGENTVTYLHPCLEPILKDTYGVILYQEQVMQISSAMAGYSLGEADMLRRAMGKKKLYILEENRKIFLEGAAKNGIDSKIANDVYDLMAYFGGYGFNKSHSAAYAFVAYQTAWLKTHYPAEFMAAMLSSVMDTADKVPELIEECKRMGIEILPPDVNESWQKFAVVHGAIRFGMAAVKNVGRDIVDAIIDERETNGIFTSIADLCCRMPMNKKTLESLIKCGALDRLNANRAQMLSVMEKALDIGRKNIISQNSNQMSIFDFGLDEQQLNHDAIELPNIPEFPRAQLLTMEKEMIGFYISGHPLDVYQDAFRKKASHNWATFNVAEDGEKITIGGCLSMVKHTVTKRGDNMAQLVLENLDGSLRGVVFPRNYGDCRDFLVQDKIVIASGKVRVEDDRRQLIVDKLISPLTLYLRLNSSANYNLIQQVTNIMQAYEGDVPVVVYYSDLQQYKKIVGVASVDVDEQMLIKVKEILHPENVVLK